MKTKLSDRIKTLMLALIIAAGSSIYAQTIEEAAELFNQGRELINQGNNKAAIEKLEATIIICDKIGEEGDELKQQVIGVMPSLYYAHAKSLFDNNQIEESIEAYKTTMIVSEKYNDIETYNLTKGVLAQLFLKSGNDKFRARDFEGAVQDLEQSLAYDSLNTTTLLLMGYSHRRLENTEEMINYFKTAVEFGGENDRNARSAAEGLMTHFMNTGAKLINAKNTADGLKYLDTAALYGQSGDLWFYYAVGYNAEQRWDDAIAAAEKAIELDPNNKENVAKYNFEIGTAYYGKKDNAKACEAYKKANFGRTALRAEPMIKTLKCN